MVHSVHFVFSFESIHIEISRIFYFQNVVTCRERRVTDRHIGEKIRYFSSVVQLIDQIRIAFFHIRADIQQNTEFIPADPITISVLGICIFNRVRDSYQALVSDQMTVMIIYSFEIIDIKYNQCSAFR